MVPIGFKSKTELRKSIRLPDMRKKVSPTLKLSREARNAPLPAGWLAQVRDYLTRSGNWQGRPLSSVEVYICAPAPGVILPNPDVGFDRVMFRSIGFGEINFDGRTWNCSWRSCDGNTGSDECTNDWCTDQDCNDLDCTGNVCSEQDCDGLDCDGNKADLQEFLTEVESHWNHPFVRELRRYFGMQKVDGLTAAVSHYITRNMYVVPIE